MEHSRSANYKLLFEPGDLLYSNRFRPLLRLADDTSPGIHDTLHAACSKGSYRYYGAGRDTPNCEDNMVAQLQRRRFDRVYVPCPWNLFEHALVAAYSTLADVPSAAKPGDYVELEAVVDLLLIFRPARRRSGRSAAGSRKARRSKSRKTRPRPGRKSFRVGPGYITDFKGNRTISSLEPGFLA